MNELLSLVVSGGVTGIIYSVLAMGLVLSYATTGIFNFGHGAIAFVTALVYYQLNTALGLPKPIAGVLAILVFAPLLGLALEKLVMRHLVGASVAAKIVATVGVLIALPAGASLLLNWFITTVGLPLLRTDVAFLVPGLGPTPKVVWPLIPGLVVDSDQLITAVMGILAALALWVLLQRTRLGLQLRAAVDAPSLAQLRGIDIVRTSRVSWVMSACLAGLAGVLAAPNPAFGLQADNYTLVLVVATAAAVFARLRSLPIAFAGGMGIGIVSNLVQAHLTIGIPGLRSSAPFWLLLVGIALLLRERTRKAGLVAQEAPPDDLLSDLPRWRRALPWGIAAAVLALWIVVVLDPIWVGVLTRSLALALVFLSFTVVTGQGGMISLAQAAFATTGALTAGLLLSLGVPFVLAAPLGALSAVMLGTVVALPALRLGGIYLALATLAIAFIGDRIVFQIDAYRNGPDGWVIPRPDLGVIDFADDRAMAILLLVLVMLVAGVVGNLQRSATGRAITALRNAEPAATASGVSAFSVRMAVFGLSAGIAGLGGVMLASVEGRVTNLSFPILLGLVWLAVVSIFGIRRAAGAVLAGMAFYVMPRLFANGFDLGPIVWGGLGTSQIPNVLFGLGAIGLAQQPEGLLADIGRLRRTRRDAARAGAAPSVPSDAAPATRPHDDRRPAEGLVVAAVTAGYGEATVLREVSLTASPSRMCAVLGANGAGKSTLCQVIAGLVPASAGSLWLDGVELPTAPHERARAGVMVAPESRGIFPGLTVEENLAVAVADRTVHQLAFDRFPSLADRRNSLAGYLSGGEQQMLALAPALIAPPRVLVVDEPTLGLAPLVVEEVKAIFRELKQKGVIVLVAEEKANTVLDVADDVALLSVGVVRWTGPRAEMSDDQLASHYLGGGPSAPEDDEETETV